MTFTNELQGWPLGAYTFTMHYWERCHRGRFVYIGASVAVSCRLLVERSPPGIEI